MATYSGSLRCAGASIGAHRHICAFFNGLDEEYRVLGSQQFLDEMRERRAPRTAS